MLLEVLGMSVAGVIAGVLIPVGVLLTRAGRSVAKRTRGRARP